MNPLQITLLVMLAVTATAVVLTREPVLQIIALAFYGILLGVLFFAFQAPDVALSQIVVGAVVLPLMALLSLERIDAENENRKKTKTSGGSK